MLAALLAVSAPAPPPCTLANATPASVREMAGDADTWLGRCVRIEGYVSGNRFYADVGGAYAAEASDADDRRNDGWLGLYFRGNERWQPALRRGTITGILNDCGLNYEAAVAQAGPEVFVMSVGYCHYWSGLTLHDATFQSAGNARFVRQVGEAARMRFGDLVEATSEQGPPAEVVELGDRFLSALKSGDGATIQQFVGPWSETFERGSEGERRFHAYLLGDGSSPLEALRSNPEAPQRAYFRERATAEALEYSDPDDWHICFCRTPDCNGRWPISVIDAVAIPSRPYVCLRAFNRQFGGGAPDRLGIDRQDNGFVEPR